MVGYQPTKFDSFFDLRERKMTKGSAAVAVLSALCLGLEQVKAQEPFRPVPVAPQCSESVRRGAQEALEVFMAKAKTELLNKKIELEREYQRVRSEGGSTAGLEVRRETGELFGRYELQSKLNSKVTELTSFALKKHGCEPTLFYFVP